MGVSCRVSYAASKRTDGMLLLKTLKIPICYVISPLMQKKSALVMDNKVRRKFIILVVLSDILSLRLAFFFCDRMVSTHSLNYFNFNLELFNKAFELWHAI